MDEAEAGGRGPDFPQSRPSPYLINGGAPPDQALRLQRFRDEHPDVEVIFRGPWQAIIAEPDGERILVRWELRDLLDELERRLVPEA
jgi:hypothetical protein